MRSILWIILGAVCIFIAQSVTTSCISDDITTDPAATIRFSRDTVSFDTVFTDLGTPTARLQVFNPNKKGINISRIRFADQNTPFSVNVDGVSGTSFENVEIRGGDSIYVFIECFIPENDAKKPRLVEDKLIFTVNGKDRPVVVEAWGQNVIRLRGLTVTEDMTLTDEQPYVIFDSLKVAPGATLHVLPGAQLLFHDKASLTVDGTIKAIGHPGRMIDMRGDRLDNVLPDVGYDILAGQWQGVRLTAESFDNQFEYVDMRSTVHGLVADSCATTDRVKLTLVNSWLHNSQASVLSAKNARINAYGCVFSEAADAVVLLDGGENHFLQCTIANYYLYSAVTEPLLTLLNAVPPKDGEPVSVMPLMTANFENSIIYGLGSDIYPGDLSGSNVYLRNVLLKSEGSDDDHFINCLWNSDPLFLTVREEYIFDYRPAADSPAVGAGNAAFILPLYSNDMLGNPFIIPGTQTTTLGALPAAPSNP